MIKKGYSRVMEMLRSFDKSLLLLSQLEQEVGLESWCWSSMM